MYCTVQGFTCTIWCTVQYNTVQYSRCPHLAALLDVDVWVSEDGGRGCDHHQPHPSAGGHHTLGWDQESMPTNPPVPYDLCISVPVYGQWVNAHSAWCLNSVLKGACNQ